MVKLTYPRRMPVQQSRCLNVKMLEKTLKGKGLVGPCYSEGKQV